MIKKIFFLMFLRFFVTEAFGFYSDIHDNALQLISFNAQNSQFVINHTALAQIKEYRIPIAFVGGMFFSIFIELCTFVGDFIRSLTE